MRIGTIVEKGREEAALIIGGSLLPISTLTAAISREWPTDLMSLLTTGAFWDLYSWFRSGGQTECARICNGKIGTSTVRLGPLFRRPRKIWGIGLNYAVHASDLSEKSPATEPASFMKPDTAIIGPGDEVLIPHQSSKTTGEAELGVIFGRKAKEVSESNWIDCVAGFTTILDMTAEDILRRNPRYLTMSKSFDTFLSFGPFLVTPDEIADVRELEVSTVLNGEIIASNVVANMTFPPAQLVSFHSKIMPWLPGDILSTGTPRAVPLADGDRLECRITGFEPLINPVRDLKKGS